jgi:catechol 2,3-dioxygenase-like lactoylglutathione lyase family enzyme
MMEGVSHITFIVKDLDRTTHSVYFYDYDNNLFELHTETLENRLNLY